MNLSLNQTLLTFLLYVRQTWMTQLILAISLWEVIFLYPEKIWYSYAWSRSLREGRSSFCSELISRKLCRFLLIFSTCFTSLSVLLLFPLSMTSLCTVLDSFSSNIDEVLSINPSANVFVFGDFNIHHKDWLTYSGGTDRPGELCYNFFISNDLTQIVNFPTWIPYCDSHSPALLDLFLSSYTSICSTMDFLPLGNSDHVVVSVSIDFPIN